MFQVEILHVTKSATSLTQVLLARVLPSPTADCSCSHGKGTDLSKPPPSTCMAPIVAAAMSYDGVYVTRSERASAARISRALLLTPYLKLNVLRA